MRGTRTVAGLAVLGGVLAACGGPSPTRVALSVTASRQLNPNADGQASPTVVTIYDLKSETVFMSASFNDLFYSGTATLGGDLLARREFDMLPGQTLTLNEDAAPGTRFIGVVAGFRAPQGAEWRGVLALAPQSRNRIDVALAPTSVTIAKPPAGGWLF